MSAFLTKEATEVQWNGVNVQLTLIILLCCCCFYSQNKLTSSRSFIPQSKEESELFDQTGLPPMLSHVGDGLFQVVFTAVCLMKIVCSLCVRQGI